MQLSPSSQGSPEWRACTPGELVELGTRQRVRIQRRAALKTIGAAAGCLLAGAMGVVAFRSTRQNEAAAIACDEVRRLLPDYISQRLSAERTTQVRKHLAVCAHCSEALRRLQTLPAKGRVPPV